MMDASSPAAFFTQPECLTDMSCARETPAPATLLIVKRDGSVQSIIVPDLAACEEIRCQSHDSESCENVARDRIAAAEIMKNDPCRKDLTSKACRLNKESPFSLSVLSAPYQAVQITPDKPRWSECFVTPQVKP